MLNISFIPLLFSVTVSLGDTSNECWWSRAVQVHCREAFWPVRFWGS